MAKVLNLQVRQSFSFSSTVLLQLAMYFQGLKNP